VNVLLIYFHCLFLQPELPSQESVRPKSWDTFVYKAPPIKLHHRLRVTIRTKANQDEEINLDDAVEGILSDPLDYLPEVAMYNLRLSFKTKSRKYKFYIGRENMANMSNITYYLGFKMKL
jgi:hypothetical protein